MIFKYLGLREQLLQEKRKNERLTGLVAKMKSDTDYIAMMTDVDIFENLEDEITEEENEDEQIL